MLTVVAEGTAVAVALSALVSSTVGSLVMVKVADPFETVAPLTGSSTPFTTKYTVVVDEIDGLVTVIFTGEKLPDTFVPFW